MREHNDIFSNESVSTIFSNIEKLWSFQQTFLQALKQSVPNNRIGEVFLEYVSIFKFSLSPLYLSRSKRFLILPKIFTPKFSH